MTDLYEFKAWTVEINGDRLSVRDISGDDWSKLQKKFGVKWFSLMNPSADAEWAVELFSMLYAAHKGLHIDHARAEVGRLSLIDIFNTIEVDEDEDPQKAD